MRRIVSVLTGLAIIAAATTTQAAITWSAGAPGGTSGSSLSFGNDGVTADFLDTGVPISAVGGNRPPVDGGKDYTISYWFNQDGASDGDRNDRWAVGTTDRGIHLGVFDGNKLRHAHWGQDTSGATVVPGSTWVHATYTYDANGGTGGTDGLGTTYYNGVADGSADKNAPGPDAGIAGATLIIGGRSNGGTFRLQDGFQGKIDDVGIWNTVLSAADVADLHSGARSPQDLNVPVYYDFEEGSGTLAANTGTTGTFTSGNLGSGDFNLTVPIPEPSSLALMLCMGLSAVGFARRKRN